MNQKPFWVPMARQLRALGLPWVGMGGLAAAPLVSRLPWICANDCDGGRPDPGHA